MIPKLQEDIIPYPPNISSGFNYGVDRVRFLSPVVAGKRIRGRFRLLSMEEVRPGAWRRNVGVTIEVEGQEKPALSAEWLVILSLKMGS